MRAAKTIDLTAWDFILINTSAGKDSQAMMDVVHEMAVDQGVADRLVAVHADLGRVEWTGTKELAVEHAAHYGIRLEIVRRERGDLLDQIKSRGMFPSSTARYCTSDQKRDQVAKLYTVLAKEGRDAGIVGRPVRILNAMGFRAEESPARAKRPIFSINTRVSNTKKEVADWNPIHEYLLADVWERNAAAGTRHHRAYDLGMPRLSCVFCIFAPREALIIAGRDNPELLAEYVETEIAIGHQFRGAPGKKGSISIVEIAQAIERGEDVSSQMTWGAQ